MPNNKFNFNIIFKEIKKQQKDKDYAMELKEIDAYNEIRELNEIILDLQEPERIYLTST